MHSEEGYQYQFHGLIGVSAQMRKICAFIKKIADTESTVLITGESGTGKEVVARTIHNNSSRRENAFVPVNCAAIPAELIESELFGHERGAFTGATKMRMGRFELADGGTLFLDEIGELHPSLQVKLLRVLQEKEFERVGGTKTMKVDVRILAATNKDLARATREGSFREDLFYRLNVIPLNMPPLRKRREDIVPLLQHFISKFSFRKKMPPLPYTPTYSGSSAITGGPATCASLKTWWNGWSSSTMTVLSRWRTSRSILSPVIRPSRGKCSGSREISDGPRRGWSSPRKV